MTDAVLCIHEVTGALTRPHSSVLSKETQAELIRTNAQSEIIARRARDRLAAVDRDPDLTPEGKARKKREIAEATWAELTESANVELIERQREKIADERAYVRNIVHLGDEPAAREGAADEARQREVVRVMEKMSKLERFQFAQNKIAEGNWTVLRGWGNALVPMFDEDETETLLAAAAKVRFPERLARIASLEAETSFAWASYRRAVRAVARLARVSVPESTEVVYV